MLSFTQFLSEEVAEPSNGIAHSTHAADLSLHGEKQAKHAVKLLKGVVTGSTPLTKKIDDKMSFHAIRTPEGKVGVKYKGSGSHYDYSEADVEKQHADKPYKAGPLKALVKHLGKVLPKEAGEYQGGFMSTPETRTSEGGKISHTPNAIKYAHPENSEEGKKLAKSKLSVTVHTKLVGKNRSPEPILDQSHFGSHPDVHLVHHVVSKEEQKLAPADKKKVVDHLASAQKLMKDHSYEHLSQHSHPEMLERYINSTVRTDEKPSVAGYKAKLTDIHNKEIEKAKSEKGKASKTAKRDAVLAHVDANKGAFKKTFDIHHHLQSAATHLANSLDKNTHAGVETSIGGKKSGGEGYMAPGAIKLVNRKEVSKNLLARSDVLKAGKAKE